MLTLLRHRRKSFRAAASDDNPGTSNLVSSWSMDETSGTRADSHGSNDLTDNNTVSYATGVISNAANFISANSENLSSSTQPVTGAGARAAEFWFKTSSTADQALTSYGQNANGQWWRIRIENGVIYQRVTNGAKSWSNTWNDGNWHHLVMQVDANSTIDDVVLYIDGTLQSSSGATTTQAINTGTGDLYFGREASGSIGYDGDIDECRYWNRVLTADEITWLYNSGSGRSYSDISFGWSPLDEASLDSYWDPTDESSITGSPAVTTLEDLGPNGNDLSANGTPQTGVRTINSLNVIDFDGINEYLSNSTYTLNSTVTFVGVFLVDANGSNVNESIFSVDATVDFQIDSGDGGSDWDGRLNPTGTGSVTSWSDSSSKNGVAMIVSVTFDAVANTIDVWYDGDNMVSLSNYTTDLDGTQDLKIMGNRSGIYTANGAFGGMAIFNSADTDIRQKAEGFFAHRFALTGNLVSGHPYISSAP